jgi:hypothetical protein
MAAPWRGSENPTPQQVRDRINAHAWGDTHAAIAVRFGISIQASKQFKQTHLPEIEARAEELFGEVNDRTADLWVRDQVAQHQVRMALIEDTIERRADPDLPARDVSRYNRDIDAMLHKAADLEGLIKQRAQAEVEVKTPFKLGDVMAFGADGQLHEVRSDGFGSDG